MREVLLVAGPERGPARGAAPLQFVPSILYVLLVALLTGCGQTGPSVVVYTSQDLVYAEPIFKDFEKQTGIKVLPVYDSESVKTVALANRLLQESPHPQCDVFWNNEEFRTRQLAARNVFREVDGWAQLGYRSRRMLINTNLLPLGQAPKTFSDATNEMWRGKVALAYPLYGTTSTHFLALRQRWGDAAWQTWCRALLANQPKVVDGNSVVAKLVAGGEAWIGFADSDDIAAEQHDGKPVVALPVSDETLFLHNTVAIVRGAPHPAEAQRLFDYLQSKDVSQKLVDAQALEGAKLDATPSQPGLTVDWNSLLRDLDPATAEMEKIFLR